MPEQVQILLDATQLDTLQSCAAKFNYRFNHNKVPTTRAKPLDRGTLVHIGRESYNNGLVQGLPFSERRDSMLAAIDLAYATDCDLDIEDLSRIKQVMSEHVEFWRPADERMKIHAVEKPFVYILHETPTVRINMMGKIDLLADFESYFNTPFDYKSYDRDFPTKRKTNQFCNYAMATGSHFLFVDKIGFQKTLKPHEKFKRIPLSYDDLFLEQWKKNVIAWVELYMQFTADGYWPLNDTSCDKFNRLCEYYEICDTSGEEGKVFKLNVNFNTAPVWDVSQSLKG